jgi:hypothetical protein
MDQKRLCASHWVTGAYALGRRFGGNFFSYTVFRLTLLLLLTRLVLCRRGGIARRGLCGGRIKRYSTGGFAAFELKEPALRVWEW